VVLVLLAAVGVVVVVFGAALVLALCKAAAQTFTAL
jgi:hypothetical protein